MEPIDIIYTPLNTPLPPASVDPQRVREWCQQVGRPVHAPQSRDIFGSEYPWDLVRARWPTGWHKDFEQEFPELADYFSSAFGLETEDLSTVTLLPTKTAHRGLGFWHTDSDVTGLRMYLENSHPTENPLVFRKTREPHMTRPPEIKSLQWETRNLEGYNPALQDQVITARILHPQQSYYINNIRAVHSPLITCDAIRTAVIILVQPERELAIRARLRDLIVSSAELYKDYAIIW